MNERKQIREEDKERMIWRKEKLEKRESQKEGEIYNETKKKKKGN